ncbi:MAG: hypothetical protein KBS96_08030 [Lachnospiraceae bacterium]|nr:hypothetical protein [Candidatus Colinaster scatohippi]
MNIGNSKKEITVAGIKLVAYITMFIDHFASIMVEKYVIIHGGSVSESNLCSLLRAIGRLAFPLFCFLLVEGMEKSRNRLRYLGQLLLMAIVSEPFFDYSLYDVWWDPNHQNVCVLLFVGGCLLLLDDYYDKKVKKKWLRWGLLILSIVAAMAITYILKTDYSLVGIGVIIAIKYIRPLIKKDIFYAIILMMAIVYLCYLTKYFIKYPKHRQSGIEWKWYLKNAWTLQMLEPTALFLVDIYNGKKGNTLPKIFYYSFYPLHLIVIKLVTLAIFG